MRNLESSSPKSARRPLNVTLLISQALVRGVSQSNTYGTQINPSSSSKYILHECMKNFQSIIQSRQGRYISQARRITLAKSVLASFPIHNTITKGLNNTHLEKHNVKVRKFIQAKGNERKGLHIIKPKSMGGLYIKDCMILRLVINGKRIINIWNNTNKL